MEGIRGAHPLVILLLILATVLTVESTAIVIPQLAKIMSAISKFAEQQKLHNDKIDAAVTGLTSDIQSLKDQIAALQNSAGEVTAEDQALLDEIQARSQAIADRVTALDALTPPAVPAPGT